MMFRKITFALICLASQPALAEIDFLSYGYVGLGYAAVEYDDTFIGDTASLGAIVLKGGHRVNSWFAFEGRIGFGVQDEKWSGSEGNISAELTYEIENVTGIYGKFHLFGKSPASPYLLLGYTTGKSKTTGTVTSGNVTESESISNSDSDLSFGVGVDACGSRWCGNAEFTRYFDQDEYTIEAITLTVMYKF